MTIFPYIWRVKTKFPERFGKPCRVLARGKMNSCEVEFEDGFRAITSRNYLRRRSNQGTTLEDSKQKRRDYEKLRLAQVRKALEGD
jgi:hypothetical protein